MSNLILPKRGTMRATEMKLVAAAIMCASYARMMQLVNYAIERNLETWEEADMKRLMAWYNNLGVDNQAKIDEWIIAFSRDTEDVTAKSGRKAVKKVSEWNSAQ